MLWYIVIFYVLYLIIRFVFLKKHSDSVISKKIMKFAIIEVVLVVAGLSLTLWGFVGVGKEISYIIPYTFLIIGVICLIASGRVGMYIKKLGKQGQNQENISNSDTKLPNSFV